jgi:hypothetical protein
MFELMFLREIKKQRLMIKKSERWLIKLNRRVGKRVAEGVFMVCQSTRRKCDMTQEESKEEMRDVSTIYLSTNGPTPHVWQPSLTLSLSLTPPSSVLTSADSALTEKLWWEWGGLQVRKGESTATEIPNVWQVCKSRIPNDGSGGYQQDELNSFHRKQFNVLMFFAF